MRVAIIFALCLAVCAMAQEETLFESGQGEDGVHVNAALTRSWSDAYVTFGKFNKLPMTEKDALTGGWVLNNTGGSTIDGCNNGIWFGKRYLYNADVSTMLLFDAVGQLAGFQLGLTNTPTGNIPPWERNGGIYTITTYYRDPATICTSKPSGGSNPVGDRLWLKMDNSSYMSIPLQESQVTNGTKWVHGKCFYTMGNHYWWNIYPTLNCEDFFPVFLLYNGGVLNGYGFAVMLNEPSSRYEHPGGSVLKMFFQPETMPQCVFDQEILSTLHVYFNSPYLNFC